MYPRVAWSSLIHSTTGPQRGGAATTLPPSAPLRGRGNEGEGASLLQIPLTPVPSPRSVFSPSMGEGWVGVTAKCRTHAPPTLPSPTRGEGLQV
jgi:hypothetical protein